MITEIERLKAVNRFKKLDAGVKSDLNDLVNLISRICEVPVALISLIDEDTQWFKASVGTGELKCNDRHLSFCKQTILQNDILIVNDATKDSRFANLPIVTGPPSVKFYAGMPLITFDGQAVGTLCILHVLPIELNDLQISAMKVLAKQVVSLIELNWSMQSLFEQNISTQHQKKVIEDSGIKLNAIFNSSRDMHILLGRQMEVLAYNKAASNHFKNVFGKDLTLGVHFLSVSSSKFTDFTAKNINDALTGKAVCVEWLMDEGQADPIWLSINYEPVSDNDGIVIGVVINATDITLRKKDAEHINHQNEALQRIATIQSHELRRPVASLMGLIEVMKVDGNYTVNDCFRMIESTINELDVKIKDIVRQSEMTLENTYNK
jgi:PAS domain S-box-containing protein